MNTRFIFLLIVMSILIASCGENPTPAVDSISEKTERITLEINEANRLAQLPIDCIQHPLPYKSGIVIESETDLAMPIEHHPAFYGCFDWHSAVHGHWSLIYLMKTFPDLSQGEQARKMLNENLTKENIIKEVAYFSMNSQTKSFERTYGWAWVLKLAEELKTWNDADAQRWYENLKPLSEYISQSYIDYLPKLVYPIRVGEHSNTGFGLSFAYDYAVEVGDAPLRESIEKNAIRLFKSDQGCPIGWEPSGYDFLSPCLQEMDIMRKVLSKEDFATWSAGFLPDLMSGKLDIQPANVSDRSDGKLVHLDGLNFSRAWCLYSIDDCEPCQRIADQHLAYSLDKITDGEYAGQHWLASFALYAFQAQGK